jgi:hypothetical protein
LNPQDQVHLGRLVSHEALTEAGCKLGDHGFIIPPARRARNPQVAKGVQICYNPRRMKVVWISEGA